MTRTPLALKHARARAIAAIRATTDSETATDLAARHMTLLNLGRWPAFLDPEAVEDRLSTIQATMRERKMGEGAKIWLRKRGLEEEARAIIEAASAMLDWRLSPDSPDALTFRGAVVDLFTGGRPVRARGDDWDQLDAAFVPNPAHTLDDLWETPIAFHTRMDRIGDFIIDLEEGAMIHTIRQELLLHAKGAIPPDSRDPAFAALCEWASWLRFGGGGFAEGTWITALAGKSVRSLIGTYADAQSIAGMRAAMDAVDGLVKDIGSIGGNRRVCTYNDAGGNAVFTFAADGSLPGDDPFTPWADVALRSVLGMAMIGGSALIVERQGALSIDDTPARETFLARLEDGDVHWFDEQACRAAFSHDTATGLALPHETGRLYRAGPGTS